jgi:GrpB-like predicted nucleotidyltransferase (UPF0157 family)
VSAVGEAAQPELFVIAGDAAHRASIARLLARRFAGGRHIVGDVAEAEAAARAGATVVLEVDVPPERLGPLRTSIRHRPCHVVVVAAEGYGAGVPPVGVWLDPSGIPPADTVETIVGLTRPDREPIVIADYDPAWPILFERLAAPVRAACGDLGAVVEHVGSTAVPGLAAKPIVDIDVVVPEVADVPEAIARLRGLGYVYQGDKGIPGREAFLWPPGAPRHHLYVVLAGGAAYARHLALRDLLRRSPELAREYGGLKRALAARYAGDRIGYTEAKTTFIARALARRGGTRGR